MPAVNTPFVTESWQCHRASPASVPALPVGSWAQDCRGSRGPGGGSIFTSPVLYIKCTSPGTVSSRVIHSFPCLPFARVKTKGSASQYLLSWEFPFPVSFPQQTCSFGVRLGLCLLKDVELTDLFDLFYRGRRVLGYAALRSSSLGCLLRRGQVALELTLPGYIFRFYWACAVRSFFLRFFNFLTSSSS